MKRLALLIVLFASPAFAAAPEICGDGIDDACETGGSCSTNGSWGSCNANYHNSLLGSGHGCDADCTLNPLDLDNDGYNSDGSVGWAGVAQTDCDDKRSDVYPGVYVPNSFVVGAVTGYKLCQTSGTYGSTVLTSVTPLCEATGSGVCRYVDCGNSTGLASDANSGLTYSLPKLTRAAVATQVNPDDFVYFIGTGTCTESTTASRAGTSGHPITWKNYPGATAFQTSTTRTFIVSGALQTFDDLNASGVTEAIDITAANDITVTRSYLHDIAGQGDNNPACLRATTSNRTNFRYNLLGNCLGDGVGNPSNVSAITWIDTNGSGGGADHQAWGNTTWDSVFTSGSCSAPTSGSPNAFFVKHGVVVGQAGTNGHQIKYNTALNCGNACGAHCFSMGSSKLRVMFNRVWTDQTQTAFVFGDIGGSAANEDEQIEFNTVISGKPFSWTPVFDSNGDQPDDEKVTLNNNIFISTRSVYVGGDNEGVYGICGYCNSTKKTLFQTNGYLDSDNNCFYSPNATAVFSYFQSSGGGSAYSYANWKAVVGQDVDSPALGDPGITSPNYKGTGSCATYGWTGATTTTTTTTTSTSTTTTLAPYLGPVTSFRRWFGGRF